MSDEHRVSVTQASADTVPSTTRNAVQCRVERDGAPDDALSFGIRVDSAVEIGTKRAELKEH
jgi:hypothetical protein